MSRDQILETWREHLVNKLQDHYGLADQDAQTKADAWLQFIKQQRSLQPQISAATEAQDECSPSRRDFRGRSKSRSANATRL